MAQPSEYTINLDVKFGSLQLIDVPSMVAACEQQWFNQTLCQVNDCVVRLSVTQRAPVLWQTLPV